MKAIFAIAMILAAGSARADDTVSHCKPASVPHGQISAAGGTWRELTEIQRAFLAGVFVLNPNTPAGLPYGDKAVLAQVPDDKGGLVLFIDGDSACEPMAVPAPLVEMLGHIGAGDIAHEAKPGDPS